MGRIATRYTRNLLDIFDPAIFDCPNNFAHVCYYKERFELFAHLHKWSSIAQLFFSLHALFFLFQPVISHPSATSVSLASASVRGNGTAH